MAMAVRLTTRWLLGLSITVGAIAGGLYFAFAAMPERRRQATGIRNERAWTEYRDDAFWALRAEIDRSDPETLMRAVLTDIRDGEMRRVLAAATDFLQIRWTPEGLDAALARSPIRDWESIEILDAMREPEMYTARVNFIGPEGFTERRVRMVRDGPDAPTWSLMGVDQWRRRDRDDGEERRESSEGGSDAAERRD